MWPNYAKPQGTHNWPQCCQSTRYGFDIDPKVVAQLLPALKVYWPNEQDPSGSDLSSSLWGHEWQKHGTCSGMDQKSYLTEAMSIELSMGTPAVLTQNVGGAAPLTELMAGFKANGCVKGQPCMAGLQCQYSGGQQWLAGVMTCWTKDFQRFPCPAAVIQNGGCTNSKIYIRSY
jgi:ribonuclease T2